MVAPILGGQGRGDDLQLLHKAAVAGDLIGLLQSGGHCRQVRLFQRPQPGRTALPPGAGVGDVKDIPQCRLVSAVVHKGNALRPALDVPPHAAVPEIICCAGRGVWPLGVDHELIQVWILIEPGSSLQKSRPSAEAAGQLHRRMVGHLRVKFVFCGYGGSSLPFMVKKAGNLERFPAQRCRRWAAGTQVLKFVSGRFKGRQAYKSEIIYDFFCLSTSYSFFLSMVLQIVHL